MEAPHTYTRTLVPPRAAAGAGGANAGPAGAPQYTYTVATKKLTVAAGDYYIAYRPFCRHCRIVGHATSSCPQARARQLPRGPGVPLPAPVQPAAWPNLPPPPPPRDDDGQGHRDRRQRLD